MMSDEWSALVALLFQVAAVVMFGAQSADAANMDATGDPKSKSARR